MLEVNKEVCNLLFTHNLLFLVEDFEIVVIKDLIDLVELIKKSMLTMKSCRALTLSSRRAMCGLIMPTVYGIEINLDFILNEFYF